MKGFLKQFLAALVRHAATAGGFTTVYETANSDPKTAIIGGVIGAIGLGLSALDKAKR